jgi:hypothetical protein
MPSTREVELCGLVPVGTRGRVARVASGTEGLGTAAVGLKQGGVHRHEQDDASCFLGGWEE